MENLEGKAAQNETPFAGEMKKSDVDEDIMGFEKLNEVENIPGKVVRVESFDTLGRRYGNKVEIFEKVAAAKKLYDELESAYGIRVPADFLIGKNNKGEKAVYSIVDKIDGKNLLEVEKTEEAARAVADLYGTLTKYFLDKLRSGGNFLYDIHGPAQYVYGKREGDQERSIYLIDTDVYLSEDKSDLYTVVRWLSEYVAEREQYFDTTFEKARMVLQEFASEPLSQDISFSERENINKHIEAIKRFLNNQNLNVVSAASASAFD